MSGKFVQIVALLLTITVWSTVACERPASAASSRREDAPAGNFAVGYANRYFEANQGQGDARVLFLSRGASYDLFLTRSEAVIALKTPKPKEANTRQRAVLKMQTENHGAPAVVEPKFAQEDRRAAVLRMSLVGSNPVAKAIGADELPGRSNYFIGVDRTKWLTDVSHYGRVRYEDIYPGIDMIFYGNQERLEYDFVIAPGADPGMIELGFAGSDKIEIDREGHLLLHTAAGKVIIQRPRIYQETGGVRRQISGTYVLHGNSERHDGDFETVGFVVEEYDRSQPLIIDPVIDFSTYLGGSRDDRSTAVAADSAGNIYVTGWTTSSDFPTMGAYDPSHNGGGNADIFITKLNPAGSSLIYSTYLGGGNDDFGAGIKVDAQGNVYIAGDTNSSDFPVSPGAYQGSRRGDEDVIIAKLGPAGSTLVYSTYLGGTCRNSNSFTEVAGGIAIDTAGNAYITGTTECRDFPTTPGAVQSKYGGGFEDAFVTKLNVDGSLLVYSTFLGGGAEENGKGIAVDAQNNAYVTGYTVSGAFPTTAGAFQTKRPGEGDAFVTKLSPEGTQFVYSTYLGGSSGGLIAFDLAQAIAVGSTGIAYVTGLTNSGNFPVANAIQPKRSGERDAFVSALRADGSGLVYSTYLGGSGGSAANTEEGAAVAVDALGNAYVFGHTPSSNFPVSSDALQPTKAGGTDTFVTQLGSDGSLRYSSYLGGTGNDFGTGIALGLPGSAVVTGRTESGDFPVVSAVQAVKTGGPDAFVTKISIQSSPQPAVSINDVSIAEGSFGTSEAVFTVSLSFAAITTTTVTFSTSDGTAASGIDYLASSGSLMFDPGETQKTITVPVIGDILLESIETFFVNLTGATNATIADGQGVGSILDDDESVIIDCSVTSLQAAIESASAGQSFFVSGTCGENVLIGNGLQRITLDGGGAGTISAPDDSTPALNVRGKGILIQGFSISGGSDGVHVNRGANAVLNSNLIQNTGGNGVLVDDLAFAVLTNNIIQNNPGAGVFVSESSTARIGFNSDAETTASPNTIGLNGFGVVVSNSSSARIIANTIQNNTGAGVKVFRDSHADIASNSIDGNSDGIMVSENSFVQLGDDSGSSIFEWQNTTTSTNTGFGIRCANGGIADGRLGSVTGDSGATSFDANCINSLVP